MATHNDLGHEGEEAAAQYLTAKGYTIRNRNWKSRYSELDIIAEKEGILIVAEVKTRTSEKFGTPLEAVNNRKIRRIVAATDTYLKIYQIDLPVRFDIIAVTGNCPPFKIIHIEDAFLPPVW